MPFALCGFKSMKDFIVQIENVSIPYSREDGDAMAVPFSTSNLDPNFH
jgi:hypothetical protein